MPDRTNPVIEPIGPMLDINRLLFHLPAKHNPLSSSSFEQPQ